MAQKYGRLLKLAEHLETAKIPRNKFNMGSWMDLPEYAIQPVGSKLPASQLTCRFSACACGEAATIPSFRRAGLALKMKSSIGHRYLELVYNGFEGTNAAAAFFGITHDIASDLFYDDSYQTKTITPRQVARQIRSTVARLLKAEGKFED